MKKPYHNFYISKLSIFNKLKQCLSIEKNYYYLKFK